MLLYIVAEKYMLVYISLCVFNMAGAIQVTITSYRKIRLNKFHLAGVRAEPHGGQFKVGWGKFLKMESHLQYVLPFTK